MATNEYHFVTRWRVRSTVEEVEEILGDATDLARWWPAVYLDVRELAPGGEHGIGRRVSLYTKGWLPYTLRWSFTVEEADPPASFAIKAEGDFVGRGEWTFEQDGPFVNVTYDWRIEAEKPLLRRFSFLFKPLFAANHRWAMRQGEESLRLELARRHARSPEERAAIPAPPGPTSGTAFAVIGAAALAAIAALVLVWLKLRPAGRPRGFDPQRLAHFEAAGWKAYYDRRWLRLFRLLAATCQEQFRIPFPLSWLAAYHAARGAAAWAPQRNDPAAAHRAYGKFFRMARRYSGFRFDPDRVAELEMRYWDIHRRLANSAEKGPLVQTMVDLHSALFGLPPAVVRESAELRVQAANLVDLITSRTSRNPAADWAALERALRACYRSIQRALPQAA